MPDTNLSWSLQSGGHGHGHHHARSGAHHRVIVWPNDQASTNFPERDEFNSAIVIIIPGVCHLVTTVVQIVFMK